MPYSNINSMPQYTHKYSDVVRRQMLHVFNSTYSKILAETKNQKEAERRAFMAMHSVVKRRLGKEKNSQDYMNHLADIFLKNLEG